MSAENRSDSLFKLQSRGTTVSLRFDPRIKFNDNYILQATESVDLPKSGSATSGKNLRLFKDN